MPAVRGVAGRTPGALQTLRRKQALPDEQGAYTRPEQMQPMKSAFMQTKSLSFSPS